MDSMEHDIKWDEECLLAQVKLEIISQSGDS